VFVNVSDPLGQGFVESLARPGGNITGFTAYDAPLMGKWVQLLKDVWKSWNAEVIFITSNFQGNKEMMEGCREAGLHAFGTLWDF